MSFLTWVTQNIFNVATAIGIALLGSLLLYNLIKFFFQKLVGPIATILTKIILLIPFIRTVKGKQIAIKAVQWIELKLPDLAGADKKAMAIQIIRKVLPYLNDADAGHLVEDVVVDMNLVLKQIEANISAA